MMDPTMPQQAFINSLYNDLDVPYSERKKPETIGEASALIDELKKTKETAAGQMIYEED